MPLNNLPSSIQAAIQQGYLERRFRDALRAKLGFRAICDEEKFSANIGETITKTRRGLLPQVTQPMAPAANSDITSGLTPGQWGLEQYILAVAQYAFPMQLNVATSAVAIDDLFLQNAEALGEQALRSVDGLAQRALFDSYMGGNTRVTTTLGSASTTLKVDDVRGFFQAWTSQNVPTTISGTNSLSVLVGATTYTLVGCVADGTAPATTNPWLSLLTFSGSGSNTSTTPGGYSGTLTFSANVSTTDGTSGNQVQCAIAPVVMRPFNATTNAMEKTSLAISNANDVNSGKLTMQMILQAKATMSTNGVPKPKGRPNYILYADPIHLTGLYQDPAFQMLFRGRDESEEFKKGEITRILGVDMAETNMNPIQSLNGNTIHRAVLCGQGALVEGVFTPKAMAEAEKVDDADGMMTVVDGIAHITREPIDVLKQVVTQSWAYIGGFVTPTDITTTSATIPTANSAALKRAIILESL